MQAKHIQFQWMAPFNESSQISEIAYDEPTSTMGVRFHTTPGHEYQYHAVPKDLFFKFASAQSAGKFLDREVKSKFEYSKVERK